MRGPEDDVGVVVAAEEADAVRETGGDGGHGRDGREGLVRRQAEIVALLGLVQEVPRVGHWVVRLEDDGDVLLVQDLGGVLAPAPRLAFVPPVRREEGDGRRRSAVAGPCLLEQVRNEVGLVGVVELHARYESQLRLGECVKAATHHCDRELELVREADVPIEIGSLVTMRVDLDLAAEDVNERLELQVVREVLLLAALVDESATRLRSGQCARAELVLLLLERARLVEVRAPIPGEVETGLSVDSADVLAAGVYGASRQGERDGMRAPVDALFMCRQRGGSPRFLRSPEGSLTFQGISSTSESMVRSAVGRSLMTKACPPTLLALPGRMSEVVTPPDTTRRKARSWPLIPSSERRCGRTAPATEFVSDAPERAGSESTPMCECCVRREKKRVSETAEERSDASRALLDRLACSASRAAHHVEDPRGQPAAVRLDDLRARVALVEHDVFADLDDESAVEQHVVVVQNLLAVVLAGPDSRIADQSGGGALLGGWGGSASLEARKRELVHALQRSGHSRASARTTLARRAACGGPRTGRRPRTTRCARPH